MKKIVVGLFFISTLSLAQKSEYQFSSIVDLSPSSVVSQGNTGTCWSFSTVSFLESEVKRINGKSVDLSEMFAVRKTYPKKAYNYVYRQGKAQFGEGGLSHDVIFALADFGVVPQSVYSGFGENKSGKYDHAELAKSMENELKKIVEDPKSNLKPDWMNSIQTILDQNMGKAPEKFVVEGKEFTPKSFAKELKLNPDDYVTLTSFTHHPYYSKFILEVPDNFSNGTYFNLPLDEYIQTLNNALHDGFTVALDADVSEKGFSAEYGMAILPSEGLDSDYFKIILPEKWVSAEERQSSFEDYSTTDDHLMHITGMLKDQIGNQYYDVKNSWGTKDKGNGGHIYMSVPYFRMKSIAYTIHKDALPQDLRKKLGID